MTDEKKIERLENRLKEVTSWWRAAEKQFSQKCKETKANQKTIERLKAENAAFRKALARTIDSSDDVCGYCAYYIPPKPDENCTPCGHLGECVDGVLQHFMQKAKIKEETK